MTASLRTLLRIAALVAPLAVSTACGGESAPATPAVAQAAPATPQAPAPQPQPASSAPAAGHDGHGAHAAATDWAALTDRDLDVASIFLTARRAGVAPALDALRAMIARDTAFATMGHVIAHALGRFAVRRAGGDPSVYAGCTQEFQAGCWHGVMEGYFTSPRAATAAAVTPRALDALCPSIVRPGAARLAQLECAHGMGHGLTARANNDFPGALRHCDALADTTARRECHDGVFMEVTVRGTEPRPGTNDASLLRKNDLRWPCAGVGTPYQPSCWAYQPIVVYEFTDDLARTIGVCAEAPEASRPACFRGFGKQAAGWLGDAPRVIAACRAGDARYFPACVAGAAESVIDESWTPARALALCRAAPNVAKPACYATIGERMALVRPDADAVARDCAAAEPAFVATCQRGGAGVARRTD